MMQFGRSGFGLRSMRLRMTALFALFVALLMVGAGLAVYHREKRRAERGTEELLRIGVRTIEEEIEEKPATYALIQSLPPARDELTIGGLELMILDQAGRTLWKSRPDLPRWPLDSRQWRYTTVKHRGQSVVLVRSWAPVESQLRETADNLLELGVLLVAATAALAWFVVGKTLSPLEKLAAQARDASIESLQVRLNSPSSDAEMRHLTATLNDLLARLEQEARARGRFYAAASHELRTPIQMLLGHIDVARSRPRTVEEHEKVLVQVQGHTERLAVLVQDLLQLNALEMGQNQASAEPVNLAFTTERLLEILENSIVERGLKPEVNIEDVRIEAPPTHVDILLRNLLENAVKYAEADTVLKVDVHERPGGAEVEIWNAYLPPEGTNPADWFEPFYRPDASRNSRTGGNGLGLAICAAIARANGWELRLRLENGGVLAALRIPADAG